MLFKIRKRFLENSYIRFDALNYHPEIPTIEPSYETNQLPTQYCQTQVMKIAKVSHIVHKPNI